MEAVKTIEELLGIQPHISSSGSLRCLLDVGDGTYAQSCLNADECDELAKAFGEVAAELRKVRES